MSLRVQPLFKRFYIDFSLAGDTLCNESRHDCLNDGCNRIDLAWTGKGNEMSECAPAVEHKHHIIVCTKCRDVGGDCFPGLEILERLNDAVNSGMQCIDSRAFEISGIACMAGCSRPCTVAFRASAKATYLFGDIDPDRNIEDLIAFAYQYQSLNDGWTNSNERPAGLMGKTLARVPAWTTISNAMPTPSDPLK